MPEVVEFLPRQEILSFEEIERVVCVAAEMGVDKIRLTGGEPLVRGQLWKLIRLIKKIDGIRDVALTTNGILLADQAGKLLDAGLDRLNVSMDTINPVVFEKITRRKGLEKVLQGIEVAQEVGFRRIRINAVSIVGISETEIIPLAKFAREKQLELRFIEFMPLDGDQAWESQQVLTGAQVRQVISSELGELVTANRVDAAQPAVDYDYADGRGRVGFINSVSEPFCSACNRMRLTAEGKFRNCLFSTREWDLRSLIRNGASDESLAAEMRASISAKKAAHGIDSATFQRPQKAMYQIGG